MDFDKLGEVDAIATQRQAALHAEAGKTASSEGVVSRETTVNRARLHAELGGALADAVIEQIEISIKYAGYIDKQNDEVERAAHFENLRLPDELDYLQVSALSFEARQKLSKHRPETLGQASRISGITPAAISLLLIHLKKGRFKGFAQIEAGQASEASEVNTAGV